MLFFHAYPSELVIFQFNRKYDVPSVFYITRGQYRFGYIELGYFIVPRNRAFELDSPCFSAEIFNKLMEFRIELEDFRGKVWAL